MGHEQSERCIESKIIDNHFALHQLTKKPIIK